MCIPYIFVFNSRIKKLKNKIITSRRKAKYKKGIKFFDNHFVFYLFIIFFFSFLRRFKYVQV